MSSFFVVKDIVAWKKYHYLIRCAYLFGIEDNNDYSCV